jgi:broad specificity phosphatase PhoE
VTGEGRRLILVRHSLPEFAAGVPASQWHLSAEGRRRCESLALRLAAYDLAVVLTSEEPKAAETGQIVADRLGLPCATAPGLHEHRRGMVKETGGQELFWAQIAQLFDRADERVMGYETANEAHARFSAAVDCVITQHPVGNLATVSHGTVITLLVTRANGLEPQPFWRRLGLPAFAVLSPPELCLLEVVDSV